MVFIKALSYNFTSRIYGKLKVVIVPVRENMKGCKYALTIIPNGPLTEERHFLIYHTPL